MLAAQQSKFDDVSCDIVELFFSNMERYYAPCAEKVVASRLTGRLTLPISKGPTGRFQTSLKALLVR